MAAAKKKSKRSQGSRQTLTSAPLGFDLPQALKRTREWLIQQRVACDDGTGLTLMVERANAKLKRQANAVWSVRLTLLARHEVYALPSLRSVLKNADDFLSVIASGTLATFPSVLAATFSALMRRYREEAAEVIKRAEVLERELVREPKAHPKKGRRKLDPLRSDLATTLEDARFTRKEIARLLAVEAKPSSARGLGAEEVAVDALRQGMPTREQLEELDGLAQGCREELDRRRKRDKKRRTQRTALLVTWLAREAQVSPDLAAAWRAGPLEYSEDLARLQAAAETFKAMSPEEQRAALQAQEDQRAGRAGGHPKLISARK